MLVTVEVAGGIGLIFGRPAVDDMTPISGAAYEGGGHKTLISLKKMASPTGIEPVFPP